MQSGGEENIHTEIILLHILVSTNYYKRLFSFFIGQLLAQAKINTSLDIKIVSFTDGYTVLNDFSMSEKNAGCSKRIFRIVNVLSSGVRGERGDEHDGALRVDRHARLSDQKQCGG